MKSTSFLLALILFSVFITNFEARLFGMPNLQGSEMRGSGITDAEVSFIKSKAIEVAKMSRPIA